MEKIVAVLLALLLLFNALAVTSFADSGKTGVADSQKFSFITSNLKSTLWQEIKNCNTEINISKYKISESNADNILEYITHYMPEAFNIDVNDKGVSEMSTTSISGYIESVKLTYNCNKTQFSNLNTGFSSKVDNMLNGIKGNSNLTDYQKTLLIHDRLIINCEYNERAEHRYDAYGAIVNGKAVCQGYTLAYMYLLNQVGIESYFCNSNDLNHSWLIVKIGNKYYHSDTTWDDPTNALIGTVEHKNFLLSSSAFYTLHKADDYDTTPTDTTFDNYFWSPVTSEFQLINNNIYYIDYESGNLNIWNLNSDDETLLTVDDTWTVDATHYYPGCHSKLSSDGKNLFFSARDKIKKYDLTHRSLYAVYTPETSNYNWIYGFVYKDNKFYYTVHDKPFIASGETVTVNSYNYTDYEYTIGKKNNQLSYLKGGNVYTDFSDIVLYEGKTYLVKNGIVDTSTDAVVALNNRLYHVKNGYVAVNEGATLLKYNDNLVYFENGTKIEKSLIFDFGGKRYAVANGNVKTSENQLNAFILNGRYYALSSDGSLMTEKTEINLGDTPCRIENGIITYSIKRLAEPAKILTTLISSLISGVPDYLCDFSRDEELNILDLVCAKKELASK